MPAAIVSDAGERRLLATLLGAWTVVYHLYANNYLPTTGDIGTEYVEPTFPGYAPVTATGWQPPLTDASGSAYSTANLAIFTRGAGLPSAAPIYGCYATDVSGGFLWGQRDDNAPISISAQGNSYVVYPAFNLFNFPPTG